MESKISYALVGIFILILGSAVIVVGLWLTTGLNQVEYNTYLVQMNEPVDGLSVNSSVTYNGVDVGYVKAIRLSKTNTAIVQVLLNIQDGIPITTKTTATLRSQGVTGVTYIGLSGGENHGAQKLVVQPGHHFPEIAVTPSIRLRLDDALQKLMNNFDKLSLQLDSIFTKENTKLLTANLQNLEKVSKIIADNSADITKSLGAIKITVQNASQTSQYFPETMDKMQNVLQNLDSVSTELKQNPSVIVRGKANPPLGPGEGANH